MLDDKAHRIVFLKTFQNFLLGYNIIQSQERDWIYITELNIYIHVYTNKEMLAYFTDLLEQTIEHKINHWWKSSNAFDLYT